MVNDVVRGVAHSKEGAGGMKMTWHPCSHVHIFTYTLETQIPSGNLLRMYEVRTQVKPL